MLIDEQVLREVILHLLYVGGRGKKNAHSRALLLSFSLSREETEPWGKETGENKRSSLLVNCKQASLFLKALMLIMERACENFGHQSLSLLWSRRFRAGKELSVRNIKWWKKTSVQVYFAGGMGIVGKGGRRMGMYVWGFAHRRVWFN